MTKSSVITLSVALVVLLILLSILHLRLGVFETDGRSLLEMLWHDDGSHTAFAVREIRMPRLIVAMLVGAALAVSGLLIQIITRNPLGDPGLTGVSGGAAFGVALAITYLPQVPLLVLACGIAGGAFAAALTFLLSYHAGMRSLHLLLAGIAVSAFFIAATGAVMVASRSSMQTLFFWMIGGFANKGWTEVTLIAPIAGLGLVLTLLLAPILAVLTLDDAIARGVGLASGGWRLLVAALSVVLAAGAVSVAGPIAFIGFIAPHLARVALGSNRAQPISELLPLTAMIGATLTLLADLAARGLPVGKNTPAGVWITVFGGLCFLVLARRISGERT